MKKVLIISSSPRKNGNSELLCSQFLKGAEAAGHQCETVYLRDHKIGPCIACDACRNNSGFCIINDYANTIGEKIMNCDVLVLATPVYFFSMSAQLKTMIDRMRPYYRKTKNKEIYLIATVSVEEKEKLESTFDAIRGFTKLLKESEEKGIIYGNSAWLPGDIINTPQYQLAFEIGNNI